MGSQFSQHNLQVLGDVSPAVASKLLAALDGCAQGCKGNLGIARKRMPQIKEGDTTEFLTWLRGSGIEARRGVLPVTALKATQREIDATKIEVEEPSLRPIIVSQDGYILDGHHRWVGAMARGSQAIPAVQVELPIHDLLAKAWAFSGRELVATRTHQEQQDDEAERLVRPAPKYKPPRHDRRRERVDTEEGEERDPDESLNYKDIGGSVLQRWAKRELITVRDKATGHPVHISPEGLKKNPGKYEEIKEGEEEGAPGGPAAGEEKPAEKPKKKPGKGKKKPSSPWGDDEEEKEPKTEAEKAGISPPVQRKASEAEHMAANDLIMDTFPREVATRLLAQNLHPDDVADMVSAYHVSKAMPMGDTGKFAAKAAKFYETNPDHIKPPKFDPLTGSEFELLPPKQQARAYRQHQMQVLAASLAAEEKLTTALTLPTKRGKPQVPRELAAAMVSTILGKAHPPAKIEDEDGYSRPWDDLDESEQKKALKQLNAERIDRALQKAHEAALISDYRIPDDVAQKLLKAVPGEPGKLAKTFLMADDYQEAKRHFLGSEGMTEHSDPADIVKGLREADKFFQERAKVYDEPEHGSAKAFRQKVLSKLRELSPDKYEKVQEIFDHEDAATFKKALAKYEADYKDWEKRKKAWDAKQPNNIFRAEPFKEPEPDRPQKPPRYELTLKPAQAAKAGKRFFNDLLGRMGIDKTASRVTWKFISTYSSGEAMDHRFDRSAVYHGIAPAVNDPGPYDGWTQVHQRDIDESSVGMILDAAKEWLKQPVLAGEIEGYDRDTQLRAALDLGLKSSGYDRHVAPQLYDQLLARLAGKPAPGIGETLTKLADGSTSSCPPSQEVPLMKPSHEVRKFAANVAADNPKLAYDLNELADRMDASEPAPPRTAAVEDNRYAQLRSLVIRTAASDAAAKKVLLPILQAVKGLG